MNLTEIKKIVSSDKYSFLSENEHLGNNVILLGLGGSHAYGTSVPESDLDIRGIATRRKEEILGLDNFECFRNESTDTTIYSFDKAVEMMAKCNPNVIELLGLKEEHYLHKSKIGEQLLERKDLFISKKAFKSFGGYAKGLRGEIERYRKSLILVSGICKLSGVLDEIDKAPKKISKSMMNLVRVYLTGIDILSKGEIITYRENDIDLLMSIRRGDYLSDRYEVTKEFNELIDEYENQLNKAVEHSELPDKPDMNKIKAFVIKVNEHIVTGGLR